MKISRFNLIIVLFFIASCSPNSTKKEIAKKESARNSVDSTPTKDIADLGTILSKKEVPVLCYHHIREAKPGQSETLKSYSVSPESFAQQMKALKDSGFETILPGDLYNYLVHGGKLPAKPVMLTFDDTDEEQYSIGYPEMKKYGFKGVFFIMTVSLGKPHYMSKEQVKELSDLGHAIGSHTWDHHNVKKYQGNDWVIQIEKPTRQLHHRADARGDDHITRRIEILDSGRPNVSRHEKLSRVARHLTQIIPCDCRVVVVGQRPTRAANLKRAAVMVVSVRLTKKTNAL